MWFWICIVSIYIIYAIIWHKYILISLDGNIGPGKSTLLEIIRTHHPEVGVLEEPIEEWKKVVDKEGKNILARYYEDKERWAYTFQSLVFITKIAQLNTYIAKLNNPLHYIQEHGIMAYLMLIFNRILRKPHVIITERSIMTDKCVFAQMLSDDKIMLNLEHETYLYWFNQLRPLYPVYGIIYLQCNPNICIERIRKRARAEEVGKIPDDYIYKLHSYHERLLKHPDNYNLKSLILNADQEFDSRTATNRAHQSVMVFQINTFLAQL